MIQNILSPAHLLLILAVALIVLGPKRLPEMARNLGRGVREFREAISMDSHDDDDDEPRSASLKS